MKTPSQLTKAFREYVTSKGGELIEPQMGISGTYSLETKAGCVHVTMFKTWIAIRFKDVEFAKQFISANLFHHEDMNPYSGKWNIQNLNHRDYLNIAEFRQALFDAFVKKIESVL